MNFATTNVLKVAADVSFDNIFLLHCLYFHCTSVFSYCNPTSYHALPFGKQSPLGWTFFFCENNMCSAFPAGLKDVGKDVLYPFYSAELSVLLVELQELFLTFVMTPYIF